MAHKVHAINAPPDDGGKIVSLTLTNEEFLKAVAGDDWQRVPISWGENSWWVSPAGKNIGKPTVETSNYFTVSLFKPAGDGKFARKKELFIRQFVFVIDDVGTKLLEAALRGTLPPPTYILETSPDNFQWGYRLTNGTDARALEALICAIVDDPDINPSLKDPGMKGVTRVARLPVGSNNKDSVKAKNGGVGWPHVLHLWEPSRAYTVEDLAFWLGVDLSEDALAKFKGASGTRKATPGEADADYVLRFFDARDMLIDATPNAAGFVRVVCPWKEEHTSPGDEAGYKPGSGGFKCHHGHCEHRTMNDLRQWVAEHVTPAEQAAALAETFGEVDDRLLWAETHRAMLRDPAYFELFGDEDDDPLPAASKSKAAGGVQLVAASSIAPERVDWIWPGYLARGKMHLLAGPSTAGKTTLALGLAATLSTGGTWPDGTRSLEPGDVLIWSGEDGISDTIVPRLLAAGADASRVHVVQGVKDGQRERAFDPSKDMPALSAALDAPELRGRVRLLIVDSLASAIAGDAHRNNEVRRGLQPIVDLAERHGVAVLGIVHFSKGTQGRNVMERINGSLAFGALARVVLICAIEESEDGSRRCMFLRGPSNIGPSGGGWEYEIVEGEVPSYPGIRNTVARFGAALTGSAQAILNEAEGVVDEGGGSALAAAEAFLREKLKDGPVSVSEIKAHAGAEGIAWRTIERAKGRVDVAAVKVGRAWSWKVVTAAERFAETAAEEVY
ncbi:AAA family ATPase [Methylocystis sp.]|uniref:AAA family ATPase n=1 Tax=Methylocystis sp. TaxID=1911079 RepID=UPI003DA69DFD